MGEKESNSTSVSLQGQELVYHKLGLRAGSDVPYIESDDIQTSALELEWDMETELEELGTEQYQGDDFANQHIASLQNHVYMTTSIQPSISPKGGFQRLQEEPEYFSHYAESEPRKSQQHCCTIIKMFCTFMFTFTIGILIGYFSNNNPHSANCSLESGPVTSSEISFVSEIVKNISKENIEKHYRYLTQISVNKADTDTAKEIALLWTSIGLKEVQLVNYSVLLDLPGSSPNTITLNNGQCYYPNGQECDEESNSHQSQEFLYSYAAFSAKGTLEGEIVDVQYGTVDDLLQASQGRNITNSFALLKLGVLPLLYKIKDSSTETDSMVISTQQQGTCPLLSLLEEIGFKGALVYVDPCDLPENENLNNKAFMVSLNNGDVPGSSTSTNNKNYWPLTQNFSSLLVQPVAVSLLQKVFRIADSTSQTKCVPLMLPETEYSKVHLKIQSAPTYKDITNVFGFLRGAVLPDRYIILGTPHKSAYGERIQEWASGAAIMTSIIESIMLKVKEGWRPHRTILFCSWGGSPFGNIGSYKWAEEFKRILENNAVAYIGLQNPIRGKSSLRSIASPSLLQLVTDVIKKLQVACPDKEMCSKSGVSSVQALGDADFFINHLGIPAVQFIIDDIKTSEASNVLSEAVFIKEETTNKQMDPSFNLHEYIAKLTLEMVLQIASEPVLPFSALDIALEIQKNIEGDDTSTNHLMEKARSLRETAQMFQSNEMRPANDPKERDPTRVRMLNDILQNMEKNFLIQNPPPGFFRNILYRLEDRTTQFSTLQAAKAYYKISKSNETLLAALEMVSNCISSAQLYFNESLHVFEDGFYLND